MARQPDLRPVGVILAEAMEKRGLQTRTLARLLAQRDGIARKRGVDPVEDWRRYLQRALKRTEPGQKLRAEARANYIAAELRLNPKDLLERPLTAEERRQREIERLEARLRALRGG